MFGDVEFVKEVKKKKNVKEEEEKQETKKKVAETPKKREKKVYDLPGQKRDPPEEVSKRNLFILLILRFSCFLSLFSLIFCFLIFQKDPLRIFYETLYEQIPSSEMSQIW